MKNFARSPVVGFTIFTASFCALMAIGWRLSIHPYVEPPIFWPATGLYLGALLASPTRVWWAFLPCTLFAWLTANFLTTTGSLATWFAFWASDSISVFAVAFFMRAVLEKRAKGYPLRAVSFVFLAGLILPALAATFGTFIASYWGLENLNIRTWHFHFGALTAGVLVVAPMVISLVEGIRHNSVRQTFSEVGNAVLYSIVPIAVVYLLIGATAFPAEIRSNAILVPIMAWISFRGKTRLTALANLFVSMALIHVTLMGRNPHAFYLANSLDLLTNLQIFIVTNTLLQLLLTSAVERRDEATGILLRRQHELDHVNRELEIASRQAREASEAKTRFVSNLNHEIRAPLGAMLGYLELLRDEGVSEAEKNQYLEIVRRNGAHLHELVNNVLDLSKIEAGKSEIKIEKVETRSLVDACLSVFHLRAKDKGLILSAVVADDVPELIETDSLRLRQILLNSLSNALKFTPQGEVRIDVRAELGVRVKLSFEVTDTGIGLSPDERGVLFRDYSQANSDISRLYGGTGLGLVLSRQLAALLGGDFRLVRSEKGQGSTFRLVIDGGLARPAPAKLPNVAKIDPGAASLAGLNILVADDSEDSRRLVQVFLRQSGASVVTAENGRLAVESLQAAAYDLILLDFEMPELDGAGALREMRALGYRGPVLAMTGHSLEEEKSAALLNGFDGYLAKPLSKNDLRVEIRRAVHAAAPAGNA